MNLASKHLRNICEPPSAASAPPLPSPPPFCITHTPPLLTLSPLEALTSTLRCTPLSQS